MVNMIIAYFAISFKGYFIFLQIKLNIFFDDLVKQDKKILVVSYAGSDLSDGWVFTDLGIIPGSTVKVCMKEEVKPVLFVKCSHSGEVIEIMDDYNVEKMLVDDLRTIVAKKSGLPVSIFRLVSSEGMELFDHHVLFDYSIECGNTVYMENWDGWAELINYSILGLTPSVMPLIVADEIQSRFQLKVAMYIASHNGCVDLARTCIRSGIRPDEPIGEHPSRQWCKEQSHIETMRSSVHEAAEFGQLGVLRLFVNADITCSMARDGHNLTPLNLALRNKQRPCASFLLTKQWVRVPVTRSQSMTLQTFRRIKLWCERCKEKAFMKFGPNKSSIKRRSFNTGPLVSHGVLVDGFSPSQMNGKARHIQNSHERRRQAMESFTSDVSDDPESYFKHLTAVTTYGPKFRHNTKWGKMVGKSSVGSTLGEGMKNIVKPKHDKEQIAETPDGDKENNGHEAEEGRVKLPRIKEKSRTNMVLGNTQSGNEESEKFESNDKINLTHEKKSKYIRTGPTVQKSKSTNKDGTKRHRSDSGMEPLKEKDLRERDVNRTDDAKSVMSVKSDKTNFTSVSKVSKKRKKVTSAMLVQQQQGSKAVEGAIPLPVLSSEHDTRPFFYHNGVREDDIVIPMMNMVSNYHGNDSRDRAIKSLAIANTFKEKPWLMQVRMAMSLTSSTLKRDVSNLRHSFHEVRRAPSRSTVAK